MPVKPRVPDRNSRIQVQIGKSGIHILSGLAPGVLVAFASTRARPGTRIGLARLLLWKLAKLDTRQHFPYHQATPTLSKTRLGRPRLFLGDQPGPSLSFSHGKNRLWAAISSNGNVGIDVAYPEEFTGEYPYARAFRLQEMDGVKAFCHNDAALGAALLWSVKEAAVKATGFGFNRFDFLDVRVGPPQVEDPCLLCEVVTDRPITAWAKPEDKGWLSVALAK